MNSYLAILKKHSLKITPKRRAVIALFLKTKRRLGPAEIYRDLAKKISPLGLPTIYRILEEFCRIGILVRIVHKDRALSYSLCALLDKHHHHFICRRCQRVEEVESCCFGQTAKAIEHSLGCRIEEHFLQIEGLCASCLARRKD